MIHFYKYQGAGNDFIIIDDRNQSLNPVDTDLVTSMCDRHFGVGADGLMLLRNHPTCSFEMIYFNADGSSGSLCGNGARCIVAFARSQGLIDEHCRFAAADGEHEAVYVGDDVVSIRMRDVYEVSEVSGYSFVDTGSPHVVIFVSDLSKPGLMDEARNIRYSEPFAKEGVNVNFVSAHQNLLEIRTYERGVEDETLACGTGVTAAAIVAHKRFGVVPPVRVKAKGGDLTVSFDHDNGAYTNVWKTGPAKLVFEGKWK
ncbi:MAG: diaminopimelate epimerase [Salibacteraceae bacterium]